MALRDVLAKLNDNGLKPAGEGRWMARCTGHDDRAPSLSIMRGTGGKVLLHCHAGCTIETIVSGMGLALTDLFDGDERGKDAKETLPPDRWPITATSIYTNAAGKPLFRVLRRTSPDSGAKTFRQERAVGDGWTSGMDGVDRVLYRLPHLFDDETSDDTVWVVEGERDADLLASLGLVATTNPGGAGKWLPAYSRSLRNRNVVIVPDNDEPGEKHAKLVGDALDGIAKSVKVLRLPGLPAKGDVSDWIGRGGTVAQLRALVDKIGFGACFMPSAERLDGEREDRLELGKKMLQFGVSFLDEALGGLMRRDLVLIGAAPGSGKTALSSNIALANCRMGKKVHYFALEAEDREIERRMKFQIISTEYHKTSFNPKRLRFIDWYSGKLDAELGHYEKRADEELRELLKNLRTYYRIDTFTSDDFAKHLAAIQEETDLAILDHFHYVDSNDANENRGQKVILKQIRDSALRADRPVLVVGHIRKSDPRNAPIIPTSEAFHGSSDIVKIATKAIMIAPDYETKNADRSKWSTYMQIGKCRQDGSLKRYAARLVYDTRHDAYEEKYLLGRLTDGGMAFEELPPADVPTWALTAINRDQSTEQPHFMDV